MTLSEVGNAAGTSALDTALPQPRIPLHSVRSDDVLLDAVRRGLAPVDPVARLLAAWPAPPARPVAVWRRGAAL